MKSTKKLIHLLEGYMSALKSNLIFFISVFPVWLIKFQFDAVNYITIILFLILLLIIHNFINKNLNNKFDNLLIKFYYSLLIAYGIDNHLSLHSGLTLNYMEFWLNLLNASSYGIVYYTSLFILIFLTLLCYIFIKLLRKNGVYILTFFLFSIFVFSITDNTSSYKNINNFQIANKDLNFEKTKLVLILDEFSGMNSLESSTPKGKEFDSLADNLAKKYEMNLYSNIYSSHANTTFSISSMVNNYKKHKGTDMQEYQIKETRDEFYSEYYLKKNKLFKKFNSISVFQNMHINFCLHKRVKKCDEFNPFTQSNYIEGFKNTSLSKIINAWKLDGSIVAAFTWRLLREYGVIDTTLSPQGEKGTFVNLLNKITSDVETKNYDLIFVHTLVPHKPYGYTEECKYLGKKSLRNYSGTMSIKKHTYNHNIDRICTMKFIDKFISNLKNKKLIDNLEILILSDHGSRNEKNNPESVLKVIFFHKDKSLNYKLITERNNSQKVFGKILF